ncbi:hypothetical protein B0T26DRAFT_328726 [Lasiosphaeria miniovina]|uniref:Uncharacterized protein n=1 Tax=Lasiosphaeria miniovina TaxID=1954250 RepID=A0AA40AM84_9PEZI|nr:uncharacterized protein B0T26DRAFT_328726 [Lasiosphaeria miniovina]KAK0718380.1 hypothetical protein B0T26DRAFT_328726 [Lasiosphaeria miniovina]
MTISTKSYVVGMTTPNSSSHHNERKRWCHHGVRRPHASPNFVSTCPQIGGVAAIKGPDAKSSLERNDKKQQREDAEELMTRIVPLRLSRRQRHEQRGYHHPQFTTPAVQAEPCAWLRVLVLLLRRSGPPSPFSPSLDTGPVLFRFPVSVESARLHSLSGPNGSFIPSFFSLSRRPCITAPRQQSIGKWGWKAAPLACLQGSRMAHRNCRNPRMPGGTNTHTRARCQPLGLLTGASIEL